MERALVLCGTGDILPEHLPIERLAAPPSTPSHTLPPPPIEELPPSDEEQERILSALARCAGNQTRAAKLLGISRGTLVSRLERYAVPRPRK
jgi:transcriptional regulator of acetoin/glycerol metabolism